MHSRDLYTSKQVGLLTGTSVLQGEVLISKLLTIDALATSAILTCEVTSLAHETGDDTVEGAALVTKALLVCAQGTEVFWKRSKAYGHPMLVMDRRLSPRSKPTCCLGNNVAGQL